MIKVHLLYTTASIEPNEGVVLTKEMLDEHLSKYGFTSDMFALEEKDKYQLMNPEDCSILDIDKDSYRIWRDN